MPHRGDCRKDGPGDPYYCLKKGVGIGKAKATRKVVKGIIAKRTNMIHNILKCLFSLNKKDGKFIQYI